MNRKEFIAACACSLGSCTAVAALAPHEASAAEPKPPEDPRVAFAKKRFTNLLEIMASRLDEKSVNEILEELGRHCASEWPPLQRHKGDIDGFIRERKQAGDEITYDREKGVITWANKENAACGCPLVDQRTTPGVLCACSAGSARYAYETLLGKEAVLGKKIQVEMKETVLRGGKRCLSETRVS